MLIVKMPPPISVLRSNDTTEVLVLRWHRLPARLLSFSEWCMSVKESLRGDLLICWNRFYTYCFILVFCVLFPPNNSCTGFAVCSIRPDRGDWSSCQFRRFRVSLWCVKRRVATRDWQTLHCLERFGRLCLHQIFGGEAANVGDGKLAWV